MTIPRYRHPQRKAISSNFLRGWVRGRGAQEPEPPGPQVRPVPPPPSPSLRGSPLSRPRARGKCDPQPLGRPKSHPTRQPLTAADSAVATGRAAPARCFSLAGPSRRRHGGLPVPGWAGGGRDGEAGWRLLRAAGEGKEERRRRGWVRSCASCYRRRRGHGRARSALKRRRRASPASPAPLGPVRRPDPCRPRAGPRGVASLSSFVPSLLGRLPRCPAGQAGRGRRPMEAWEGWRAGGEEGERRVPATADGGASGRRWWPGLGKGQVAKAKARGVGRGGP